VRVSIIIHGCEFEISRESVLQAASSVEPASLRRYFVEVNGRRFPPKQLIRVVTGTQLTFNSSNARSVLTRLGFDVRAVDERGR
jgi:hypothetical protein